jgi:hypothetical protein
LSEYREIILQNENGKTTALKENLKIQITLKKNEDAMREIERHPL